MRIEPQHAQLLAGVAAMAGNGGDRAQAEAMVAAQQDRQATFAQLGGDRFHHHAVPFDHFRQVPIALDRLLPGVARTVEVAAIGHVDAALGQRFAEAGNAQCLRPEPRAAVTGADIGRRSDQRNRGMDAGHAEGPREQPAPEHRHKKLI
jgi:hypothetical protein